ncbi:protein snakeskin-like [Colletes gigas]|uniref:protein snakeskin-like n=1 Tax=Colletes gigas TaxID=935657 RepID=UPI001C9A6A2C|nr:protein snakeskin-like [Colletes gigas]
MVSLSRLAIIKSLQLLVVCVLIGLHYHSFNVGTIYSAMFTMGTFGGYLIILVGLCAGNLMGTPVNRRVDLFFSLIGCALFIVVGALNIDYFLNLGYRSSFRDTGLAKGSISIIEGALLLVDSILTFRGEA